MALPVADIKAVSTAAQKDLLVQNWMTHDAMWMMESISLCGMETANRLNQAAVRQMARVEARRIKKLLGLAAIEDFASFKAFIDEACRLVLSDFMEFSYSFPEKNVMLWSWPEGRCFAYRAMRKAGHIEEYQCGIIPRIESWLESLNIKFENTPIRGCLQHTSGACEGRIQLFFAS